MASKEKKSPVPQPFLSTEELIPIFKEMLSANPSSLIFLPLAEAYRRQRRFHDAIQICQAGLNKFPAYHSARVSLAMAYYDNMMVAEAKEEFLQVIEALPENLLARRMLALIFLKEGQIKDNIVKNVEQTLKYWLDNIERAKKLDREKTSGTSYYRG